MANKYTTKATWLGTEYGCRIFRNGKVVVEARCKKKDLIGPAFRDMLRTLDKGGGDAFTSAARHRKFKDGNLATNVTHWWGGKKKKD
jgi:hypothetical protein